MIINTVELETVCGITSKLPDNTKPEFAFAGKSNVGKSSLINALMNRKAYARTSSQPGKTQTINFYNINDALYYVDLPGYGYAKVAQEVKAKWGKMIENYLHTSHNLKAATSRPPTIRPCTTGLSIIDISRLSLPQSWIRSTGARCRSI